LRKEINHLFKLTTLLLSILIFFCLSASAQTKYKVIFDSDTNNELDDQHAIAYLLFNQDVFDVIGITTNRTYNGGSVSNHTAEAKRVVEMCGSKGMFPVLSGADGSYDEIKPHLNEPDFDGHEAIDFIIEQAHKNKEGKLLLLPVGKITNIALAFVKDSTIIPKVKVVWMGTQIPYGNPEYNQENDISAAQAVIESDVELWLCPADGSTGDVGVSKKEIYKKMPGKGPYIETAIEGRDGKNYHCFGDYSVNLFNGVSDDWRSLYDMAAVATVKNPEWAKRYIVTGAHLNDNGCWFYHINSRKITYFREYDTDAVMNDFWDSMNNPSLEK